jgi:signal transduction histidine kinase
LQRIQYEKDVNSEKIKPLIDAVRDSINEIREISYDLHPHQIDRLGLKKAIESMLNRIRRTTGIRLKADINHIDNLVDKKTEIILYRCIQEGLNNIIKHSMASEATLQIRKMTQKLIIILSDNGCGFDPKKITSEKSGLGLRGIRERIDLLGGSCHIQSKSGAGTTIMISIPYQSAD